MVCPVCFQPDIDNSQQTDTHFQLLSIMVSTTLCISVTTVLADEIEYDWSLGEVGPSICLLGWLSTHLQVKLELVRVRVRVRARARVRIRVRVSFRVTG